MKKKKKESDISEVDNISFCVESIEVDVDVDTEEISLEEYERICEIVEHMRHDIYIDKTYVEYPQNPRSDAFIYEEGWDEFVGLVKKSFTYKKVPKYIDKKLGEMISSVCIAYLYSILDKYNHDCSSIYLSVKEGKGMSVEYFNDPRTKWEM